MAKLAGRYQILRELGRGGFGVTYLAEDHHQPSRPKCVVKQLKPQPPPPPELLPKIRELFEQEAKVLERLGKHDQIPQLLAHFEEMGDFYIVQEFIEGQTLRAELDATPLLAEKTVIKLLKDGLEVLSFVHRQGVIHRDIKPENLIRRQDGRLCLIDFGAVKAFATTALPQTRRLTKTVSIGTVGYMPDEQRRGKPLPASDVYALGMVAIEALTSKSPLDLNTDPDTGEIVWCESVRINNALTDVITKMVRHHYSRRYDNGTTALSDLEQISLPKTSATNLISKPKPHDSLKVFSFISVKVNSWGETIQKNVFSEANFFVEESLAKKKPKSRIWRKLRQPKPLEMILIPAGESEIGSPEWEEGRGSPWAWADPKIAEMEQKVMVTLPSFFISKYPITQSQYQLVTGGNPSFFKGHDNPVEKVSWQEAIVFCEKLSQLAGKNYRLPSEAEWEYACRAKTTTPFHFGPTLTMYLANYSGNERQMDIRLGEFSREKKVTGSYGQGPRGIAHEKTTEVGLFPPNDFGLHDMHGNVCELCQDSWWTDITHYDRPTDGASICFGGIHDSGRAARGGAWFSPPESCRSASRFGVDRHQRENWLGFRVACSIF
jgi:formylglycine-generating enzyme required for sulfatase activity/predicted Ser/Thr protein kinase